MLSRHLKLAGLFALTLAAGPLPAGASCSNELHMWDAAEKNMNYLLGQDQSLSKQIAPAQAAIVTSNFLNKPPPPALVQQLCTNLRKDIAALKRAFLVMREELYPNCKAAANDATCTQAQRDHASNVCVIGLTLPIAMYGTKQKAEQMTALYDAMKCSQLSP